MVHVGIDLGTSNTLVAVTGPAGVPEIRSIHQDKLVPSVIYIEESGGRKAFGRSALDEWASPDHDPRSSFRRWKLDMGTDTTLRQMRFGGDSGATTDITPELLTTWLVEEVLTELAQGVGGEEIESVVITVPHGWRRESPEKCRATRLSAGRAIVNGKPVQVHQTTLSEPVAAAVYWLWEARQQSEADTDEFIGRTVLVCDIGGGTFDLSLVRVGTHDEPLVVIDAINHEFAGDYVTALVMGQAARAFNAEHGTSLPESADLMLDALDSGKESWPREWFIKAEELQREMSIRINQADRRGVPATRTITKVFDGPDGQTSTVSVLPDEFTELLVPFYDKGRGLTRTLLDQHVDATRPYAVVFAGGGSRIAGVRERIVRPAMAESLGAVSSVDEILGRIALNDQKVDHAIALGAALVANGVVRVEERLLCDVGIESTVQPDLADELGLPDGENRILLTPVLAKGASLPAVFRAADHGLPPWIAAAGATLDINVVIDDDPSDPWIQPWQVKHPADGRAEPLDVVIEADTDGVLSITLRPRSGSETTVLGTLSRARTGRASLLFVVTGDGENTDVHRVSLEQLRTANSIQHATREDLTMTGMATRNGIETMIRAMASNPNAVSWDDWLALAAIATTDPVDWVGAVQALDAEEQYQLLDALRRDDAGPFADALLIITARYAQEIEDAQVREFLLSDAVAASGRRLVLMTEQRDQMSLQIESMEARQSAEFDLAVELARREARLQELLLEEIDTQYEQVHAVEAEIRRLETFRESLKAYDPEAREAERVGLSSETESLRTRRELLEQQIATAIGDRDQSQAAAQEATQRLSDLQQEEEELRTSVATASQEISDTTAAVIRLRNEHTTLAQQVLDLERERATLEASTSDDARRVAELRDSPAARDIDQLAQVLAQVWPLLPADQAERQFGS